MSYRQLLDQYFAIRHAEGSQLQSAIEQNSEFKLICDQLTCFPITSPIPQSLDEDYLTLLLLEGAALPESGFASSVDKLEETVFTMSCLEEQLREKTKWMEQKIKAYEDDCAETKDDCLILQHQNKKL